MSVGLNRWTGIGNLGADPELRTAQSGTAILRLRLACGERFKNANDEWEERTEWVSCTCFGKRAEGLYKHLKKGQRVYVEGSLRTTSYEKDGVKKYNTEVIVRDLLFAGDAPRSGGSDDRPTLPKQGAAKPDEDEFGYGAPDDTEIPF